MATMDQVRRAMHRQPFRPFLIKLVEGTSWIELSPLPGWAPLS